MLFTQKYLGNTYKIAFWASLSAEALTPPPTRAVSGRSILRFNCIPLQKFHNIFLHILLIQNILSIFLYFEKKRAFLSGRGVDPPPSLADATAKNAFFYNFLPLVVL